MQLSISTLCCKSNFSKAEKLHSYIALQVGGVVVLSDVLANPVGVSTWAEEFDSDSDAGEDDSEVHQMWLLALKLLFKAVKFTTAGVSHVATVSSTA